MPNTKFAQTGNLNSHDTLKRIPLPNQKKGKSIGKDIY